MSEQEIIDLGFEIQHQTTESSGSDYDWYYYTLDIGDICLITNADDEAVENDWDVSIFDFQSCVIKDSKDLIDLIKIFKANTKTN
tara:strand:+ start:3089 stop:3343 length:255 start_codon:yes stop_codon:yes gene_type:complete